MKNIILSIVLLFACCASTMAQQAKIGYYSTKAVLAADVAYQNSMKDIEKLRKQITDELTAAQKDFTEKYELFLEQQADLDDVIRQKRQADLQELLNKNEQFRDESLQRVKQAEEDAIIPAMQRIKDAISNLTQNEQFIIIIDTDKEACPYINPDFSEDITKKLK